MTEEEFERDQRLMRKIKEARRALEDAREAINYVVLALPTGPLRNLATAANLQTMAAGDDLAKIFQTLG